MLAGHTVIVTSDTRREVGVEEEFLLIDSTRLRAMPDGEAVVAEASRRLPEFSGDGRGVAQEFKREQVETGSAPRTDLAELESDLEGLRTSSVRRQRGRWAVSLRQWGRVRCEWRRRRHRMSAIGR